MDLWIYGRFCLIMLEGATQELRNVAIVRIFFTSLPLPSIQRCCLHRSILDNITNCPLNATKQNFILKRCKTIFSSCQYQPVVRSQRDATGQFSVVNKETKKDKLILSKYADPAHQPMLVFVWGIYRKQHNLPFYFMGIFLFLCRLSKN